MLLAVFTPAFALSNATYGSPRMTRELRDDGITVGRHRGRPAQWEKNAPEGAAEAALQTNDRQHRLPVAPNLLRNQDFERSGARTRKWAVADISYVWTRELTASSPLPSSLTSLPGRVVGHGPPATGSIRNWRCWPYAGPSSCRCPSVRAHSTSTDRGSQYCSIRHQAELERTASRSRCRARKLLRQRHGRDVLQDPQGRTRLAHHLPEPDRSGDRNRPLHRRLLSESRPPPFGARLHQPASVRRAGGVKSNQLALHKCQRQVHAGTWCAHAATTPMSTPEQDCIAFRSKDASMMPTRMPSSTGLSRGRQVGVGSSLGVSGLLRSYAGNWVTV